MRIFILSLIISCCFLGARAQQFNIHDTLSEVEVVGKQKKLKTSSVNLIQKNFILPNPFNSINRLGYRLKGFEYLYDVKNVMLYISDNVNESIFIKDIKLRAEISDLNYLDSVIFAVVLTRANAVDTIINLTSTSYQYKDNKLNVVFNQQLYVNQKYDGFYLQIKDKSESLSSKENIGLKVYLTNKKYPYSASFIINGMVTPFKFKDLFTNLKVPIKINENDNYNLECEINYLAR